MTLIKILSVYVILLALGLGLDLITKADLWPSWAKRTLLLVYLPAVALFMVLTEAWAGVRYGWDEFLDALDGAWGDTK
jgi:hypothetical protein